jgi:Protein of unknown function (DUF3568)
MTTRTRFTAISLALSTLGLSSLFTGCSSVKLDPTGDMVAVYQFGEFRMLLNTTAPIATTAAQKALPQFDLFQTSHTVTTYSSVLNARNRSDQKIVIDISEVNSRQTLVRIRWGAGGDLVKSRRLYEAIEANLAQ